MRLQREAKMAVRDIESQMKKYGKLKDTNFICLPDPEDLYTWYYIIFNMPDEFKGGYYIGKVKCKDNYPAVAPNITIFTDNGKFRTNKLQPDGICLSISDFHPESWNPAWKVNQIVLGLVSFWNTNEYTYGSIESYDYTDEQFKGKELKTKFAMHSREHVMGHEMYEKIFKKYASAIGIEEPQTFDEWTAIEDKIAKIAQDKIDAEEKKKREAEEKRLAEEAAVKAAAEAEAERIKREEEQLVLDASKDNNHKIFQNFFQLLKQKDLTKYVGRADKVLRGIKL